MMEQIGRERIKSDIPQNNALDWIDLIFVGRFSLHLFPFENQVKSIFHIWKHSQRRNFADTVKIKVNCSSNCLADLAYMNNYS